MWFVRYHGGLHIDRVGRWLRTMYSALAVRMALAAILVPIFLVVPAIRILFNIWPIIINRYFGVGFFLYYCLGTPILYQVIIFSRTHSQANAFQRHPCMHGQSPLWYVPAVPSTPSPLCKEFL